MSTQVKKCVQPVQQMISQSSQPMLNYFGVQVADKQT